MRGCATSLCFFYFAWICLCGAGTCISGLIDRVNFRACVCVCVCERARAGGMPGNVRRTPGLSRHHHVTCDLLESHTDTTITNTPHLGEEGEPETEVKCVRKTAGENEEGKEDKELSITSR